MENTINQDGIDRLKAAAQAEADFFRDYCSEPTIEEIAEVVWAEANDEGHAATQAEFYTYAGLGMSLDQSAYMATLDYARVS